LKQLSFYQFFKLLGFPENEAKTEAKHKTEAKAQTEANF